MSVDVIKVILADDHAVVRAGVKAVLGAAKDIQVIGEASNGREAVALAERVNPDVIVMDLSMGEMDGITATQEMVEKKIRGKILILTMHAEDAYLVKVLEAGASGYLVKDARPTDLVEAIEAVHRGEQYLMTEAKAKIR